MEAQRTTRIKKNFFEDNVNFREISSSEAPTIKGFQDINENEEVWLLQCPKGVNVEGLEGQKLKLPGRIKINDFEAAALETTTTKKLAFGYSHKHKYHVKIIPIVGSIVIRQKIAAPQNITEEDLLQSCPPVTVEMPEYIKLRHPLLGAKFDEYIKSCDHGNVRRPARMESSTNKRKTTSVKEPSPKKVKSIKVEPIVSEDLEWIKHL